MSYLSFLSHTLSHSQSQYYISRRGKDCLITQDESTVKRLRLNRYLSLAFILVDETLPLILVNVVSEELPGNDNQQN